ncbi:MAG: hypothetical protein HOV80_24940 [Polyangiaceae bacterium]|nr:hypothetical protein [Polyangiaceae bacterium]
MLSVSLVCAGLLSCGPKGGTDVGNGATVSFNLRAIEDGEGSSSAHVVKLKNGVEIDSVWIAVEHFELRSGEDCGGDVGQNVSYEGRAIANLVTAGITGERPVFDVPAGPYCRLRMRLHKVAANDVPTEAPAELAGNSILITGRRADQVPFTVTSTVNVNFRLDASDSSFEVEGDEPFILGFSLLAMIDSLALDTYTVDPIVISDALAPQVVNEFDRALRQAVSMHRDTNADGALSVDESASRVADGSAEE